MGEERSEVFQVFVVSDGTGDTAGACVRAAMLQFEHPWRMRTFGEVRHASQVQRVVSLAAESKALVVFSLVDRHMVRILVASATARGVQVVDLLGALIAKVAQGIRSEPRHQPGLLHSYSDESFARVDAVEFAVQHDDGTNLHTLFEADIVLVGVSRTSKTPLSIYLAQRGYKTGNVPLVSGIDPPQALLDLDPRKTFGLYLDPATLLVVRQARLRSLGVSPTAGYADPDHIAHEIQQARRLFRERRWRSIDVSGRAVEESASKILELYGHDRSKQ